MKRVIICLFLCIFLTACSESRGETPSVILYFPSSKTGLAEKKTDLELQEISAFIEAYCQTQPPEGAESAIPEQWSFRSASCEARVVNVVFAGQSVSQLRTNLAAVCLLRTLVQFPEVDSLRLYAPGCEVIQLKQEDVLLQDSGMLPQKESIILYVPDADGRFLIRQTQTVEAVEAADKPRYVLLRLLDAAASCIPNGTRLLNVSVEHEICTVDLSSEFLRNMKPNFHCERMAVYAIANSLTELPEVKTVEFWVEGAPLEELKYMKLPNGIGRDETLIAPTDSAWLDVALYASCDEKTLVKIPVAVAKNEERSAEETALDALLEFTGQDGAVTPIPEGTKRLSVLREGNTCIVDLTGEFVDGCRDSRQEMLAVQSVIATMCALDSVTTVEILVEGLEPNYSDAGLKNLSQPQAEWFSEQ